MEALSIFDRLLTVAGKLSISLLLIPTCSGRHVSIPHGGHRDDDPVEGVGDGRVLGLLLLSLDEVAEGGEEEAGDADEEDKQSQLLVAVLQRERNRLQSSRVPATEES